MVCIANVETDSVRKLKKISLHLPFKRVQHDVMMKLLSGILEKEAITTVSHEVVHTIVTSSNGDVRHAINELQFLCTKQISPAVKRRRLIDNREDDSRIQVPDNTIFGTIGSLYKNRETLSHFDCCEYYFSDSFMVPAFVQENVIKSTASNAIKLCESLDSISHGDAINQAMYEKQLFDLMPYHGLQSVAIPVKNTDHEWNPRIDFPKSLGKYSAIESRRKIVTKANWNAAIRCGACYNLVEKIDEIKIKLRYALAMLIDGEVQQTHDYILAVGWTIDDFKSMIDIYGFSSVFKTKVAKKTKTALTKTFVEFTKRTRKRKKKK